MTAPGQAAMQLLLSALLGAAVGLGFDMLRPLSRRHSVLADLLFFPVLVSAGVVLSFPICRGNPTGAAILACAVGVFGWNVTAGRVLRPVFFAFWGFVCRIVSLVKKFLYFFKKPLCKMKKIGYNREDYSPGSR